MDNGLAVFLGLGVAILIAALVVGRLFRRTMNRPMPGADEGDSRAWWFAGGRRGDDGPDYH